VSQPEGPAPRLSPWLRGSPSCPWRTHAHEDFKIVPFVGGIGARHDTGSLKITEPWKRDTGAWHRFSYSRTSCPCAGGAPMVHENGRLAESSEHSGTPGFHGSPGEIRLPADACRLDQEPALRDDAAIPPGAAFIQPAGISGQASRCSSVSQDSGFEAGYFWSRRVRAAVAVV
jgi:hypothetical protein